MTTFKPHVPKPLVHSPREEQVLKNIYAYLICTWRDAGPGTPVIETRARIHDPGQCVAALRIAKQVNVRCLVYALGPVYGTECQALVDEKFLLEKMHALETLPPRPPANNGQRPDDAPPQREELPEVPFVRVPRGQAPLPEQHRVPGKSEGSRSPPIPDEEIGE